MSRLSLEDRILLLELFIKNHESTTETFRNFRRIRGLKEKTDPCSPSTLRSLLTRFRETGSVGDKSRSGRPSLAEERSGDVEEIVQNSEGATSVRKISYATSIPTASVHRILTKVLELRDYKFQIVPVLSEENKENRCRFAQQMLEEISDDPYFLNNILFTDEACFHLNGVISNHYCRIWSSENPHATVERGLNASKVTVWVGFSRTLRLTPYFFDGNVNGEKYRNMISEKVIPDLKSQRAFSKTIFQQDGASSHTAHETISLLKRNFRSRLLSLRGDREWPPHSPDLNPLDYFLWAQLKREVFAKNPKTLNQLRQFIDESFVNLPQAVLSASIDNFPFRLLAVLANEGGHIE